MAVFELQVGCILRLLRLPVILAIALLLPVGSQAAEEAAVPATEETSAPAVEPVVTAGAEVDFASRYMWRGLRYSAGPVLQPYAWISAHGFTFDVWTNFVLTGEPQQGHFNEVDLGLSYEGTYKNLTYQPSIMSYNYMHQRNSPSTAEFALKLAYPVLSETSFFTTHTWDVAAYRGGYFFEAGLEWEREVNSRVTAEAALTLGAGSRRFNQIYIGPRVNALNVVLIEAAITYHLTPKVYLKPHVGFSVLLNGRLRDSVIGADTLYAGILIGTDL